jgi:hypothetical protein
MRLRQITEAPLGDFKLGGDTENEGSFRPDDLRAMKNPKWLEKVRNAFSKTPYRINVFAYNGEGGRVPFMTGHLTGIPGDKFSRDVRNIRSNILTYAGITTSPQFIEWFGSEPPDDPNDITVVFLHNEGDNRIPLTPWMLAHRLGHAVFLTGDTSSREYDPSMVPLLIRLNQIFQKFTLELGIDSFGENFTRVMGPYARSKAARTGNLNSVGEFGVELFAEYLILGEIKFRESSDPRINNSLVYYAEKFNTSMTQFLDAVRGKIVVM